MTPWKNLWRSLDEGENVVRLEKPARELLRRVCGTQTLHAKFLNTLSLLEHIGSRKIMLSQQGALLKEDVLRHLAEEARHAHFFRRAAERVAARALDYEEDTLASCAGRMYFGRLDAAVTRELGRDQALAYLYVTLAIELRAGWLYRFYEEELKSAGSGLTLQGVLAEEDAHLRQMEDALREADPLYSSRRRVFRAVEAALFERWLAALEAAVPGRKQEELPL